MKLIFGGCGVEQCQTVGASMGLKNACPRNENNCRISCQDPTKSNSCVVLSSLLVDGSPCGAFTQLDLIYLLRTESLTGPIGFGGTCSSGTCQAGSLLETAKVLVHPRFLTERMLIIECRHGTPKIFQSLSRLRSLLVS